MKHSAFLFPALTHEKIHACAPLFRQNLLTKPELHAIILSVADSDATRRKRECECAGTGRQARLRGVCQSTYGFKSRHSHHLQTKNQICGCGGMADALASGASVRKDVGVQVPPSAPKQVPLWYIKHKGTCFLSNFGLALRPVSLCHVSPDGQQCRPTSTAPDYGPGRVYPAPKRKGGRSRGRLPVIVLHPAHRSANGAAPTAPSAGNNKTLGSYHNRCRG